VVSLSRRIRGWFVETNTNRSLEFPGYQPAEFPVIDKSKLTMDEATLRKEIPVIMAVREAIQSGLEAARNSKQLGSSLQCSVVTSSDDETINSVLTKHHAELDTMFVVSSVDIFCQVPDSSSWSHRREFEVSGGRGSVHVLPPKEHKCQRCWRYLAHEDEGLCPRCHDIVQ
jgi:isoleucyl-tRNA synthetase